MLLLSVLFSNCVLTVVNLFVVRRLHCLALTPVGFDATGSAPAHHTVIYSRNKYKNVTIHSLYVRGNRSVVRYFQWRVYG